MLVAALLNTLLLAAFVGLFLLILCRLAHIAQLSFMIRKFEQHSPNAFFVPLRPLLSQPFNTIVYPQYRVSHGIRSGEMISPVPALFTCAAEEEMMYGQGAYMHRLQAAAYYFYRTIRTQREHEGTTAAPGSEGEAARPRSVAFAQDCVEKEAAEKGRTRRSTDDGAEAAFGHAPSSPMFSPEAEDDRFSSFINGFLPSRLSSSRRSRRIEDAPGPGMVAAVEVHANWEEIGSSSIDPHPRAEHHRDQPNASPTRRAMKRPQEVVLGLRLPMELQSGDGSSTPPTGTPSPPQVRLQTKRMRMQVAGDLDGALRMEDTSLGNALADEHPHRRAYGGATPLPHSSHDDSVLALHDRPSSANARQVGLRPFARLTHANMYAELAAHRFGLSEMVIAREAARVASLYATRKGRAHAARRVSVMLSNLVQLRQERQYQQLVERAKRWQGEAAATREEDPRSADASWRRGSTDVSCELPSEGGSSVPWPWSVWAAEWLESRAEMPQSPISPRIAANTRLHSASTNSYSRAVRDMRKYVSREALEELTRIDALQLHYHTFYLSCRMVAQQKAVWRTGRREMLFLLDTTPRRNCGPQMLNTGFPSAHFSSLPPPANDAAAFRGLSLSEEDELSEMNRDVDAQPLLTDSPTGATSAAEEFLVLQKRKTQERHQEGLASGGDEADVRPSPAHEEDENGTQNTHRHATPALAVAEDEEPQHITPAFAAAYASRRGRMHASRDVRVAYLVGAHVETFLRATTVHASQTFSNGATNFLCFFDDEDEAAACRRVAERVRTKQTQMAQLGWGEWVPGRPAPVPAALHLSLSDGDVRGDGASDASVVSSSASSPMPPPEDGSTKTKAAAADGSDTTRVKVVVPSPPPHMGVQATEEPSSALLQASFSRHSNNCSRTNYDLFTARSHSHSDDPNGWQPAASSLEEEAALFATRVKPASEEEEEEEGLQLPQDDLVAAVTTEPYSLLPSPPEMPSPAPSPHTPNTPPRTEATRIPFKIPPAIIAAEEDAHRVSCFRAAVEVSTKMQGYSHYTTTTTLDHKSVPGTSSHASELPSVARFWRIFYYLFGRGEDTAYREGRRDPSTTEHSGSVGSNVRQKIVQSAYAVADHHEVELSDLAHQVLQRQVRRFMNHAGPRGGRAARILSHHSLMDATDGFSDRGDLPPGIVPRIEEVEHPMHHDIPVALAVMLYVSAPPAMGKTGTQLLAESRAEDDRGRSILITLLYTSTVDHLHQTLHAARRQLMTSRRRGTGFGSFDAAGDLGTFGGSSVLTGGESQRMMLSRNSSLVGDASEVGGRRVAADLATQAPLSSSTNLSQPSTTHKRSRSGATENGATQRPWLPSEKYPALHMNDSLFADESSIMNPSTIQASPLSISISSPLKRAAATLSRCLAPSAVLVNQPSSLVMVSDPEDEAATFLLAPAAGDDQRHHGRSMTMQGSGNQSHNVRDAAEELLQPLRDARHFPDGLPLSVALSYLRIGDELFQVEEVHVAALPNYRSLRVPLHRSGVVAETLAASPISDDGAACGSEDHLFEEEEEEEDGGPHHFDATSCAPEELHATWARRTRRRRGTSRRRAAASTQRFSHLTYSLTADGAEGQQQLVWLCQQCIVKEANTIFLPCGHLALCARCADKISICRTCKRWIDATITLRSDEGQNLAADPA